MNTLERLDTVKAKLVATSVALQEADKWTSLAKQIEQVSFCVFLMLRNKILRIFISF